MLAGTFEFPLLLFSVYGIGFGRLVNMLKSWTRLKSKNYSNRDRFLVLSPLCKRTPTARDLLNDLRRAHGIEISDETVRRPLDGQYYELCNIIDRLGQVLRFVQ
jgi:hypothetical protein